jgi:hypothetical protein
VTLAHVFPYALVSKAVSEDPAYKIQTKSGTQDSQSAIALEILEKIILNADLALC